MPYFIYLISHCLYKLKILFIPKMFVLINRILWGAYVPASCTIDKGTKFGYGGIGVVIHARAVIGKNCTFSQCVTIGGRSRSFDVPIIGVNVFIDANAVVIHDVHDSCRYSCKNHKN